MKIVIFALLYFAIGGVHEIYGLEEDALASLISRIPKQTIIEKYKGVILGNNIVDENEMAKIKGFINEMRNDIIKLKTLIVVGKNIFEYPGLLTRGIIDYNNGVYSMYIGVYLHGHEGSDESDFTLLFDRNGVIKSINKVIHKN